MEVTQQNSLEPCLCKGCEEFFDTDDLHLIGIDNEKLCLECLTFTQEVGSIVECSNCDNLFGEEEIDSNGLCEGCSGNIAEL